MRIFKLDAKTLHILNKYNSYREASERVGCSHNLIREACINVHRGRNAKGYKWFAMDEITGLNHYDLRKNEDGTNLSLDDIRKILNIEKEMSYNHVLVKYMEHILKEKDMIELEELEELRRNTIEFIGDLTGEIENRK